MSALAARRPSIGTSVRNVTDCAGAKKLETVLSTAKIAQIWRTSVAKARSRIRAARMRSLEIMTSLGFQWSTNTPATGAMTASGRA